MQWLKYPLSMIIFWYNNNIIITCMHYTAVGVTKFNIDNI